MSPSASIKGISYVSSNTYSNQPYASRRRPVPASTRSASSTRTLTSGLDSTEKASNFTFLTPRSAPLSPKPSILYREVTVIAPENHGKRRHQPSKAPAEVNSSWLITPQRSNRNSIKENLKHLSFSSTHSQDNKAEKQSLARPSSVDKASISRPMPEERSSRAPTPSPKKAAPQPLPMEHRPLPVPQWNSFRTFANATPPLPHRSTARTSMDLSAPSIPPLTRPTTSTSCKYDNRPALTHKPTTITRPVPYNPTRPATSSSARDSGTAESPLEHTASFPLSPPAIPDDPPSLSIPSDLKSFINWSDTDSDAASALDPRARRTKAFKRLVRERASLRNLRDGFDSAVEGVKRQVQSERPSATASHRASVVPTRNASKAGTPMKISSPIPMSRPGSPTQDMQSRQQFARYDRPNPNVWVSASGVPQGNAVKRRSTHLANDDLASSPGGTGMTTRRGSAHGFSSEMGLGSGSPKRQMSQLDYTRQERARQAQRLEKAREERERKARTDAKAKSKKERRRDGRIFDEKRGGDGCGRKEKKSWLARLFCG